jgi:heptosyltransferase I
MRIAIVKLSALGDIVHAMIVLQFIKQYNHGISIDWFVEQSYKELLEFHPDINKVHLIKLKKAKKIKSLVLLLAELNKVRKLESYDVVIDLQGLIKSALISKLIPSIKTIGFDRKSSREGLASFFYNSKLNFSYSSNIIERNKALIEFALGINISREQILNKVKLFYPSNPQLEIKVSSYKKNILLIPGASHISKCYPVSRFAELTSLIDANFIIIWGNQDEKILAKKIKNLSSKVNICNKLNLDSLVTLISRVDLVIGPDTGPTHIAWAMNIPSITLFGPTPGYRNTYETCMNKIIESDSIVDPNNLDKNDYSIKDINIRKILDLSQDLLKSNI